MMIILYKNVFPKRKQNPVDTDCFLIKITLISGGKLLYDFHFFFVLFIHVYSICKEVPQSYIHGNSLPTKLIQSRNDICIPALD